MLRSVIALVTTTTFLAAGCSAGRPWPNHPVAITAPELAAQAKITTIDVLPLDLELWAQPNYDIDLTQSRESSETSIMNVALQSLTKRNYAVGAVIDWNGAFDGGDALEPHALLATMQSLARYGAMTDEHPGQLPIPYLPARLGSSTGADATLYIGGWGYVARPSESSTGTKVVEGVLIGLLVIGVVVLVLAALGDHGGGGHGGGGGGHSSGGGGGGHSSGGSVASHGGSSGLHAGASGHPGAATVGDIHGGGAGGPGNDRGATTTVVVRNSFTASRGVEHFHSGGGGNAALHVSRAMVDVFGRTIVDAELEQPDWGEDPALPHDGSDSQMYLEMTLVDNHTGLALWHAHQVFPANAASAGDTARAARTMLQMLPDRLALPRTAAN
ncbi:MAG TPA: hypothetical protein VH165_14700 [Kofleriaceae bacterium]|nr:hypothetical protein [Kofleriaceae bacterium]